jgi:hypothetical protein
MCPFYRSGGVVNVRDRKEFGTGWFDWQAVLGYKPQSMLLGTLATTQFITRKLLHLVQAESKTRLPCWFACLLPSTPRVAASAEGRKLQWATSVRAVKPSVAPVNAQHFLMSFGRCCCLKSRYGVERSYCAAADPGLGTQVFRRLGCE